MLAAHVLGLDEVPCIVLAHLTPTQRRAYVLERTQGRTDLDGVGRGIEAALNRTL